MPSNAEPQSVLYGYALAYLAAPGVFDSAHVIEFIGALPDAVKYTGKVLLAAPFALHSWNGVRHLLWDSGKCASPDCLFAIIAHGGSIQSSPSRGRTRLDTLCSVPPPSRLSRSSSCDVAVTIEIASVKTSSP